MAVPMALPSRPPTNASAPCARTGAGGVAATADDSSTTRRLRLSMTGSPTVEFGKVRFIPNDGRLHHSQAVTKENHAYHSDSIGRGFAGRNCRVVHLRRARALSRGAGCHGG